MIIGISGPSCSGKTTLARLLAERVGAATLHLDRYYLPDAEHPVVEGHRSYERPHQYDGAQLLDETMGMSMSGSVVVEGFLLFTYPRFLELCDRRIHLDVPHDVLAERRAARARAKAAAADVRGGRVKEADDGWAAHGREEWQRFGAIQAILPTVEVVKPGITHPADLEGIVDALLARRAA